MADETAVAARSVTATPEMAAPPMPPMRADARRNRARVLQAAEEVFAAQGIAVPLDEIARRAGVGAGTVYRHFPTKEALFEAVVSERVEQMLNDATALLSAEDAGAAFFEFFAMKVEQASLNKALSDAIELSYGARNPGDHVNAFWVLTGRLLERAQRAGAVRADLDADEVRALMVGCVRAQDQLERKKANHIVKVLTDGMRRPC